MKSDYDLRNDGYYILRCPDFLKQEIKVIKKKVEQTLNKHAVKNVVRNLHNISDWHEFGVLWTELESRLHEHFPISTNNMYMSHKSYGGIMIANAPRNMNISQKWHVDTVYLSYTVCIALVDCTLQNGCTQLLPHTQNVKPRKWRSYYRNIINLECKEGDVVIFDGCNLHRGFKNTSNEDRPIIITSMSQYGFTNDFTLD